MRSLVPYDDLSPPQQQFTIQNPRTQTLNHVQRQDLQPPSKKRKVLKQARQPELHEQYFNDSGNEQRMNDDLEESKTDGEESRELTYDEIWDDSALVDAWNAATEEYEVRSCCISHLRVC